MRRPVDAHWFRARLDALGMSKNDFGRRLFGRTQTAGEFLGDQSTKRRQGYVADILRAADILGETPLTVATRMGYDFPIPQIIGTIGNTFQVNMSTTERQLTMPLGDHLVTDVAFRFSAAGKLSNWVVVCAKQSADTPECLAVLALTSGTAVMGYTEGGAVHTFDGAPIEGAALAAWRVKALYAPA